MIKCNNVQTEVLKKIVEERIRQDRKWGIQHHTPLNWLAILVEEIGKLSKDILDIKNFQKELIQVAAVAVVWLEDLENNKGKL